MSFILVEARHQIIVILKSFHWNKKNESQFDNNHDEYYGSNGHKDQYVCLLLATLTFWSEKYRKRNDVGRRQQQ